MEIKKKRKVPNEATRLQGSTHSCIFKYSKFDHKLRASSAEREREREW